MNEFNIDKLDDLSNFIFKKSITAVQKEISKIPNGTYTNSMMIDGFENPIKLNAKIVINKNNLTLIKEPKF